MQLTFDSSSPQTPYFGHLSCPKCAASHLPRDLSSLSWPLLRLAGGSQRLRQKFAHGSRYMASSSGVEGDELGKPDRRLLVPSANDTMISLAEHSAKELSTRYGDDRPAHSAEDERRASVNVISRDQDACRTQSTSLEIIDSEHDTTVGAVGTGCKLSGDDKETWPAVAPCFNILPRSSHSDGSIYKGTDEWKKIYRITDRTETRLEAMMFSDPSDSYTHAIHNMFQIFSLKLSKIFVDRDSVELYGYIAVRDNLDPLLNYVFNCSRDDSIIVEQGSLLNMTGPKRGIEFYGTILIEYDMRIKIGEEEKDDLQLIDGVSIVDDKIAPDCRPITCHIHGDCGVIDITAAYLSRSVEATVEVVISEVQGSFRMCLNCFSSGLHEEIQLFDGAISESRTLKRSVVAVEMDTQLDLKFELCVDSSIPAEYRCSFNTNMHGRVTEEIKADFALISVKVTWSTLS